MKQPKIALLTNCTLSSNYAPLLNIEDAPEFQTMKDLLEWWVTGMKAIIAEKPEEMRTPGELYAGASFNAVTEIAQVIGHENIFVINRGAGLVRHNEKMVPYNFTFDKYTQGSAYFKVIGEKFLPQIWWSMINRELHDVECPISEIKTPDGKEYDIIITALPDGFMKLISSDLERLKNPTDRLFMPMPISHTSGVPRNIRGSCVPYTTAYTNDVEYTKYTKSHCMTMKFLMTCLETGNFLEHANAIRDAQMALSEQHAKPIVYAELFELHPTLLKAPTVDAALQRADLEGIRIGSKARFMGAWRGAHGTQKISPTKTELGAAQSSLKKVMSAMSNRTYETDDRLLEQVGLFIAAIREEDVSMIFTVKEIINWGKIVFEKEPKNNHIHKATKVSSILRTHTDYLGLEQLDVGTLTGYRVLQ